MANSSNLAFCLEYSDHKSEMMDAFDDYLRNESLVDVMLSCEGNIIKAHKLVLSAGSTYFRNIFTAFKNPIQFPVLIIKDMPFRDLKVIVEFLYRGEVVVPVEQVESLFKSAQTLFIKGLEKYFNKSAVINVDNHSSNQTLKTSTQSIPNHKNGRKTQSVSNNSVNVSKGKQKQSKNERSISMSLRTTQRPDYKQLSNGDFNSDEDMSETELQFIELSAIDNHKQSNTRTDRKYSGHGSKQIKSELINKNYRNDGNEENSDDNDVDNQSEVLLEMDVQQNEDFIEDYNESDDDNGGGHTSQQTPKTNKNSVRMASNSREINDSLFNQRKSNDKIDNNPNKRAPTLKKTRPIKGDPDKVEILYCALCPRVFSQQSSLNIHMKRIHSEDREHICHICNKKYSWRSGLYKHMRIHRNQTNC